MADPGKNHGGTGHFVPEVSRMAAGRSWLMLLLLLLATPGCLSSRRAARQIVEAPNHLDPLGVDKAMKPFWDELGTNYLLPGTAKPILPLMVPVGPPEAELSVMVLPPQDYHLKISSKVDTSPGGKQTLDFWMFSETNAAPQAHPPDRKATIFVLHGYMLNKETMAGWAFFLAQSGYRVVLVDLRGHGRSTGETVSFGKHETEDFRQLVDFLKARGLCDDTVGVLGYSYGADLALHWAARDSRVRTVVAIAPFNHPEQAIERFSEEMKIPITRHSVDEALVLAAEKMDINWNDWSGEAAMRQLHVPVLLIGGGKDAISRPDDIAALKLAGSGDTTVLELPKANHAAIELLFNRLSEPILTWFQEKLAH